MRTTSIALILICIFFTARGDDFVECMPLKLEIYGSRQKLIDAPELRTKYFLKNLERVLRYYQVPCKLASDGNLLVDKKMTDNRELLWNYCVKANDVDFLKLLPK